MNESISRHYLNLFTLNLMLFNKLVILIVLNKFEIVIVDFYE